MEKITKVLITKEQIAKRVAEMGAQISKDYEGKSILCVCILKGAMIFLSDLIREITVPVQLDTMQISSYGASTVSSGKVSITKDLKTDIKGKDVLIVEDIVDTGISLKTLLEMLKERQPASIKVAAFLDKPERRVNDFKGDYIGYEIPNEFAIGYGLDYAERYRELPYVGVLDFVEE